MFKSKDVMVALIPKKVVKKDQINSEILSNKNLLKVYFKHFE